MATQIANYQIVEALSELVKDKNLEPAIIVETLKQALLSAVKKRYGTTDNITVNIDNETGALSIFAARTVVYEVTDPAIEISIGDALEISPDAQFDDILQIELNPIDFGRNAIMVAKQSLIQKMRETERELIYSDFKHKQGEIISGMVTRIEKGNVIVNLGKTEGIIPRSEQIPEEHLPIGKSVRSYVKEVRKESSGPQIILSRRAPEFVKKLFEFEVPEVYEGRVQILGVSREAGERAKISVYSSDDRIDPVGACVGLKGTRVQSVVKELSNEKIDIIPFSPDPEEFIKRAIAPAEVVGSFLHPDEHKIVLVVPDEQLSLAIGKSGVNARLAARLVGWRLTIYGEAQYKSSFAPIEILESLSPEQLAALRANGIDGLHKLARMKMELVRSIPAIGDNAENLLQAARQKIDEIEEQSAFVTKDKKLETTISQKGAPASQLLAAQKLAEADND